MTDAASRIEPHATRFMELREQLSRILGARTVDLIIERAAVEIDGSYPAMKLVRFEGENLDLQRFAAAMEQKSDDEIRAAFEALTGVVMLILARLLGREVATRLVQHDDRGGGYARGPG